MGNMLMILLIVVIAIVVVAIVLGVFIHKNKKRALLRLENRETAKAVRTDRMAIRRSP